MREKIIPLIECWLGGLQDEFGLTITREMIDLPNPPNPNMGDYALSLPLRLRKPRKQLAQERARSRLLPVKTDAIW